jgi:hypothetical protein
MQDAEGATSSSTLTINITGTNDAPSAIGLSNTTVPAVNSTGTIVGNISVTDPDSTSFTFATNNPNFTVTGGPGAYQLVLTDSVGGYLPPSVTTITATDSGGLSVSQAFAITLPVQLLNASNVLMGSFGDLKHAVDAANADAGATFTIRIAEGAVSVGDAQVVINKNITIDGAGMDTTTLLAGVDTGTSGDARGMILVNAGKTANFSDLTIDGTGHAIAASIYQYGSGTIDRVHFDDIQYGTYLGIAVSARPGAHVDITRSEFTDIGRVSAHYVGSTGTVSDNSFTGKGAGDHLDYAVEAGAGAQIQITNNTVTGNLGVAASDGSTSAAFLVTDYFAPGTTATIGGNTVTNSSAGVYAGYLDTDASQVTFLAGNHFVSGVETGVLAVGNVTATGTQLVDGAFDWYGGPGANAPSGSDLADTLRGDGGTDTLTGFGGDDTLEGGAGTDTATYAATLSAANFSYDALNNQWVVNAGGEGTDNLGGIEKVTDGAGHTYLLVDPDGSYTSIQAAIDAAPATGGASILIAAGTYNETSQYVPGNFQGLYINKPDLTLQGYSSVDGNIITNAADAQQYGPTVVSAAQNMFGANHWVDVGGTNTAILGLHLQAGPETNNKLLEIWADNVTVENNFIDVNNAGGYTGAAAIYINDADPSAASSVNSYLIAANVLNDGIYVASGVGTAGAGISSTEQIINNNFVGQFDAGTGNGTYDMVAVQGLIPGVGWQLEPAQVPTISGNHSDGSVPFIFRMTDNILADFPTAAQIAEIAANNTGPTDTYAYLLTPDGQLQTYHQPIGGDTVDRYYVANSIDTLNLGADSTPDNIYGGKRIDMQPGDQLIVQSGAGTVNSAIMADNLTVKATEHSTDLNLTLGTQLADGSPIAGGGVHVVTLADYAPGLGANVDVTGNALDNSIIGNSGNNTLAGGGGSDNLVGGLGSDTFDFNATSESSATLLLSDVISDFVGGTDKIDLSTIDADTVSGGDQAFLFAGNNASTVANSVTWSESLGNTILQIDNTGDTTADMQIILTGAGLGLTATDFIL